MSESTTIHTQQSDIQLDQSAEVKAPHVEISPQPASSHQPSAKPSQQHMRPHNGRHTSINVEEFMTKPLDIEKHSKVPWFLRMRGSITPQMIVPLLFVACWSTIITCISQFVYPLVVSSLLLTVLGFVVGLGISFRTSSAYDRYTDGRKYWAQVVQASRDLARHIWIHAKERHEVDAEKGKADLLAKLTALNLITAFAIALKHKLRFEPYTNYEDLQPLVSHLSTFAGEAYDTKTSPPKEPSIQKVVGEYLGLTMAESNPRKLLKRANKNLGNLPLEILTYLSAYTESIIANGTFDNGVHQGMVMANLASLNECLTGTERILNTPLPIAYSIAISQITWVYVIALPFQLWDALRWVTIPGTIIGAYIILGIAAIGREIEDPFGHDVNDLPLDQYCRQIEAEIDVIASKAAPKPEHFITTAQNRLLYSLNYQAWSTKSVEDIRASLKAKTNITSKPQQRTDEYTKLTKAFMNHSV